MPRLLCCTHRSSDALPGLLSGPTQWLWDGVWASPASAPRPTVCLTHCVPASAPHRLWLLPWMSSVSWEVPLGRWEWGPEDERREAKREESVPGAGRGGASKGGAGEPVVVEVGAATHGLVSPCHSLRVAEAGPRGAALMSRSSFPGRPWVHPGWWAAAGASG